MNSDKDTIVCIALLNFNISNRAVYCGKWLWIKQIIYSLSLMLGA